jgi:hypothetical protein
MFSDKRHQKVGLRKESASQAFSTSRLSAHAELSPPTIQSTPAGSARLVNFHFLHFPTRQIPAAFLHFFMLRKSENLPRREAEDEGKDYREKGRKIHFILCSLYYIVRAGWWVRGWEKREPTRLAFRAYSESSWGVGLNYKFAFAVPGSALFRNGKKVGKLSGKLPNLLSASLHPPIKCPY